MTARSSCNRESPGVGRGGTDPAFVEHLSALRVLINRLPLEQVNWALTRSTSHALQGVPVEPRSSLTTSMYKPTKAEHGKLPKP
jgi:hypothetical protein